MDNVSREMDYFLKSKKYQTSFDDYQKSFSMIFLQFYQWINAFLIIDTLFYSIDFYVTGGEHEYEEEEEEEEAWELIEMLSR